MVSKISIILCTLLQINFLPLTQQIKTGNNAMRTSQPIGSYSDSEVDNNWEFDEGLEGWASASSSEMQAEVYHRNGEMRIKINGEEPHFDSPRMFVKTRERQTVAIRYRYVGPCKYGKIRLRGGASEPLVVDHGFASWDNVTSKNTDDEYFEDVFFPVTGGGKWQTTYAFFDETTADGEGVRQPLFRGNLTQMRIWPVIRQTPPGRWAEEGATTVPNLGNSFHVDWIRLVRGPVVERITGCSGEKYSNHSSFVHEYSQVEMITTKVNHFLKKYKTIWDRTKAFPYGRVYNCLREGGEIITLEGKHFGSGGVDGFGSAAQIFIDGNPCTHVVHDVHKPQEKLTCITPSMSHFTNPDISDSKVEIRNGKLPSLTDTVPFFRYASLPPKPTNVSVTNVAARSIDLNWNPGGSVWDHMTYTGFRIRWKKESSSDWDHSTVTGNVSCTTVTDLSPNENYSFSIAGLVENQTSIVWEDIDLYGRRDALDGALEGSIETISSHTLAHDVNFRYFNANLTQNHGAIDRRNSTGPTGIRFGEGHYGLILVGDANIENCNSSSFCCDDYDYDTGSCQSVNSYVCEGMMGGEVVEDNEDESFGDLFHSSLSLPGDGKLVKKLNQVGVADVTSMCGPALRLTGSSSRLKGAAWYPRQLEVGEGFDTQFTIRISNPSFRCNNMNDVHTRCRSRGADGLAFVVQWFDDFSMGDGGQNLGYGGIKNSLAVEFDTYYNYDELEPYENHISVHTRGWRHPNNPNHTYSLAHTNNIPDLTDGELKIRIKYVPQFDITELSKPTFMASPYTMYFFENADYPNGGMADWSIAGLGMLYVYAENLVEPVLVTPLNLAATLHLNHGRAWVGFTSATGIETWQVHDVLDWTFSSLRLDAVKYSPTVVNGVGAHACSESSECVHY